MIVDDDPIFRYISEKKIEKVSSDLVINSYSNGKEALDFLHENYADENFYYIFLDINMPVMDGWEFLGKLEKAAFIKLGMFPYTLFLPL